MSVHTLLKNPNNNWSNLSFNSVNLNQGSSEFGGRTVEYSGQITVVGITGGTVANLATIPTSSNTTTITDTYLWGYCTSGTDINESCAQRLMSKIRNVAGTLTSATVSNSFSNDFLTGLGVASSGSNILVDITTPAGDTVRWNFYVKVYMDNI